MTGDVSMGNEKEPSSLDEIFKDYKGSDHVEEVDWGKDVGKEIISDGTDCICSFEIDEDTKDKVMAAAAKYGMTLDEYFNAFLKYMFEHKKETKEFYEQHKNEPKLATNVRMYQVKDTDVQ